MGFRVSVHLYAHPEILFFFLPILFLRDFKLSDWIVSVNHSFDSQLHLNLGFDQADAWVCSEKRNCYFGFMLSEWMFHSGVWYPALVLFQANIEFLTHLTILVPWISPTQLIWASWSLLWLMLFIVLVHCGYRFDVLMCSLHFQMMESTYFCTWNDSHKKRKSEKIVAWLSGAFQDPCFNLQNSTWAHTDFCIPTAPLGSCDQTKCNTENWRR